MPTAAGAVGMKLMSTRMIGCFGFKQVLIVNTVMIGFVVCLFSFGLG